MTAINEKRKRDWKELSKLISKMLTFKHHKIKSHYQISEQVKDKPDYLEIQNVGCPMFFF